MKKHLSIRVAGKVQGVYFRASTKEKADELGIVGIVRNERDGSVYIEAEAEEEILKSFVAWCQQGPRAARVDLCDIKESELKGYTQFSVNRY
ncbi:MAG TPA: acylphosphatase [Cyclobacteriaceae bacterium]|jgi:acylphosphatase|nr:acylphosphatase [Cyclobacteriaceae bacterium]